jgi:aminoglycoside 2'-N-acetyltransferase I
MPVSLDLGSVRLRRLRTDELTSVEVAALRSLMTAAFASDDPEERFAESDWEHALGGLHLVAGLDGRIVAHASVVPRELHAGGRALRTGYVEAVAVDPGLQRRGLGSLVMRAAGDHVRDLYELGALGTAEQGFYERLGWRTWRGPSSVRAPGGERRTPDEDGYILVLETPSTPGWLDLDATLSCEWRPGDAW